MVARMLVHVPVRRVVALALLCAAAQAQPYERGMAGCYGATFDGQMAASGEIYHQEQFTAAHRTLPFGTTVRIRRVDTGASVVVLINDRGPFIESRIVDLSNAAARKLGMVESGVVPVALEILHAAPVDTRALFAVQAGTFRILANAERTRALMERLYGVARIIPRVSDRDLWCVLVGAASTQADAETLASAVRQSAKGIQSAFVVRLVSPAHSVTD